MTETEYKIPLEAFIEAYMDCRKNKRSTANALKFELDWESKLVQLYHEVNQKIYRVSRSICFIVRKGVKSPREVFAAEFRDRVIHHLVVRKLNPLLEEYMVKRRYSTRKGFGTLDSSGAMFNDIITVTENFKKKDCWVAKFDIKSFFMSLDRKLVWRKLRRFIKLNYKEKDIDILLYLVKLIILNDPTEGCIKKCQDSFWDLVPDHKSLLKMKDKGKGFAIGNYTSQIFANFFLTEFDRYIESLFPYHVGFVDDHGIVTDDKNKLLNSYDGIRQKLSELKLELNQNKYYLQHYTKGIKFTGCQIKIGRRYPTSRVVTNFIRCVYGNNQLILKLKPKAAIKRAIKFVASLNSYLGIMSHFNSYHLRRKILTQISKPWFKYFCIGSHHTKVILKKRYLLPYRYISRRSFKIIYGY